MNYSIAVLPGDGTGPEVVAEGLKVLEAAAARAGFTYDLTSVRLRRRALPAHRRDAARFGRRGTARVRCHLPGRHRPSGREARHPRTGHPAQGALRPRSVHQPASGQALPGGRDPAQGQGPGRHRLHRRAREHRGPLRVDGRVPEEGHAGRDRRPGEREHAQGRRALPALRLRLRWPPGPAATTDALRQDERADLRVGPLVARVQRDRRRRTTRRSRATTRTSTPSSCGSSRTRSGST